MASDLTIDELKAQLLKEVDQFCKNDGRSWKKPIVDTLHELHGDHVQAVFFGGTLRSLLSGRILKGRPGRPRDVDVVVSGVSLEVLRERFENIIERETRFGGLQLKRRGYQFDVWPLQKTWAFVHDSALAPAFECLPTTTFFNLEAIAVEVWTKRGRPRQIFSGDDQFFHGILNQTLEVNREENPFPQLCVVRALLISASLNFKIGPRLAAYITEHGLGMTVEEIDQVQIKHYGKQNVFAHTLRDWINVIADAYTKDKDAAISLPRPRQLSFWMDIDSWPQMQSNDQRRFDERWKELNLHARATNGLAQEAGSSRKHPVQSRQLDFWNDLYHAHQNYACAPSINLP